MKTKNQAIATDLFNVLQEQWSIITINTILNFGERDARGVETIRFYMHGQLCVRNGMSFNVIHVV